jgi:translocation and assembly module TamB
MPRRTRRALAWSAAAVGVMLASAAALGVLIQNGWLVGSLRQTVVTRLSEALGRRVALGGLGGDPVRGIDLRDLVIAEPGGFSHGVALSVDRAHVTFDLRHLILHPSAVLQGITHVDLDRPRLVVARSRQGAWNLADLIKPSGASGSPQFHGRISVRDGVVAYADAYYRPAPFTAKFQGVTGTIDMGRPQQVTATITGRSTRGEVITMRGRYVAAAGAFDLDLTMTNGEVPRWGDYLVRFATARWTGGRFGARLHLLLTPSRSGLAIDYTGTATLADAALEYLPTHLRLQRVSGPLALDSARVSSSGIALVANGSPVRVQGDVAFPGGPWLDLAISSPGLDLATVRAMLFPNAHLGMSGRASGDVWVTGPVSAPYLDGDVAAARGRFNRQAVDALSMHFQYAGGLLAFQHLRARLGGGTVAGDAVLQVSGTAPSVQFVVSATDIDTGVLTSSGLMTAVDAAGHFSGTVAGLANGPRAHVLGDVTMASGTARGQPFQNLHAFFWDDLGEIDLDFLGASVGQMEMSASGHVSRAGALDLAIRARDVPLSEVGARLTAGALPAALSAGGLPARPGAGGAALRGHADLAGRLTGTLASPVISGAVAAWDGDVGPVPFAFARGDITASLSGIASSGLDLMDGPTAYHLSGGLRFHPLAAEHLQIDADRVQAADLLRRFGYTPDVSGTVFGHVTVTGPVAHPSGDGHIALEQGSIAGQPVDRAEATLSADGRTIRIVSADAERQGAHVHAEGTVDPSGPLDVHVSADNVRIENLSRTLGLALAPRGTLALSGEVLGTLRAPDLRASLLSPDLTVGGQAFTASGMFEYQPPGVLRVEPLTLAQGASRYSLTGTVRMGAHPSTNLTLDVHSGQIATIAGAAALQLPAPIAGTIDGRITVVGPIADPSARLALSMHDGRLGAYPLGTGVADLTLRHGSVDIRRLELTPDHGRIAAQGRVVLAGASDVEVSAQDLDPNMLRPLFHLARPLTGRLDFTMQWSGPTRNPTGGLSLEATNIGVPGAVADRAIVLAYYKNSMIHIEDGTIEKDGHAAVIQGTLPTLPGTLAPDPNGPLALGLHLQDADLSLLSLLWPQVQDAGGTVQGEVTIGGTVDNPQMNGSVSAQGGHLRIAPMQTPFDDVGADITFSQDQIRVRSLSATVGGGHVTAQGTVAVRDLLPETVALHLDAQHAVVDVPGLYAGGVDAALALAGPSAHPVLSGTVTLSQGQVQVNGGLAGPGAGAPPVGLNLDVVAGRDVALGVSVVRVPLTGRIHVGGVWGNPRLSGTARALGGTINILGTPFMVTGGEAVFSEALGVMPQITAHAQAVYGETRVFVDVSGVLPNATITWSSDPPMSQQDILALVLGTSSYAGSTSVPGASQALGQVLLGSLGQAIQRALHLDEFAVSYTGQSPVTLRIGKFILRDLYLSLAEVFGGSTTPYAPVSPVVGPGLLTRPNYVGQSYTVLGLEYFLSSNVYLSYNIDTLGDNAVFLLTRFPL